VSSAQPSAEPHARGRASLAGMRHVRQRHAIILITLANELKEVNNEAPLTTEGSSRPVSRAPADRRIQHWLSVRRRFGPSSANCVGLRSCWQSYVEKFGQVRMR